MIGLPPFPPQFPLVFLSQLLFGVGFNQLVKWAHQNKVWHVSVSVTAGVAGTLIIPILLMGNVEMSLFHSTLMYGLFFAASGLPMIWGSTTRTVSKSHKRRRLPNTAMQVRDDVVMDLNAMADEIVNKGVPVEQVVHRIHKNIGSLKSL